MSSQCMHIINVSYLDVCVVLDVPYERELKMMIFVMHCPNTLNQMKPHKQRPFPSLCLALEIA